MDYGKAQIIGHLAKDPEHSVAKKTKADIVDFVVAVNRSRKVGNKYVQHPTYIPCKAWGRKGMAVFENLAKGSRVFVEGKFNSSKWKKEDGTYARMIYIDVVVCLFLEQVEYVEEEENLDERFG